MLQWTSPGHLPRASPGHIHYYEIRELKKTFEFILKIWAVCQRAGSDNADKGHTAKRCKFTFLLLLGWGHRFFY